MKFQQLYRGVFEPELLQEIESVGVFKEIPAESVLIESGTYVKSVPLVIEGSVKIIRIDQEGNELLLYFLHPGETCAMALSCCIGHTKSQIRAVAETDLKMITIPIQKMEEWSSKYKSWRDFVMKSYHKQLMDAFETIDIIAFSKLDERLKLLLKNKKEINGNPEIRITHQEIATNLNSSRVVISRLLKKLENENYIELKHNKIRIINL